ncbi:MAG: SIMPL domain-containing protein [Deltaproteobacteria bacterium]|nr:SIMPL domain-containing protein [Deltaproteobacteria bacterium]
MTKTLATLVVLLGFSPLALADAPQPRLVTTSGSADVKVAPDTIEFVLGIETRDKDLLSAKKQNSDKLQKTMALLRKLGIDSKHIQTDYVSIQPDYSNDHLTLRAYIVQRTLAVTLKDLSKFEALLTGVLQVGVNHVHSVDFRTTELRKHRDRARALAIQAARDKALALAKELGQKVGRPHTIRDDSGGWWGPGRWWGGRYSGMSQNVQQASGGPSESGGLALGMITVTASVTVAFELQ